MQSRVLIVEDEAVTGEAYCRLIADAGFQACSAEDYDQAVTVLDSPVDLALLDVHLPFLP